VKKNTFYAKFAPTFSPRPFRLLANLVAIFPKRHFLFSSTPRHKTFSVALKYISKALKYISKLLKFISKPWK